MIKKNNLKSRSLGLFFTCGVSLKIWADVGMIDREVAIYNRLSPYLKKIYFFSYGAKSDYCYVGKLAENITLVTRPAYWPKKLYSLLLPIIHWKILKQIDFLKTNQMYGAWTAVIAKILFRKKLIVRTGYTWSLFSNKSNQKMLKNLTIKLIERITYSFADGIIVSSDSDLEYLKGNYILRGIKKVIPNYIDTDIFKPLNVPKKTKSLCFVGRLDEQKNLVSLLKALVGLTYTLNIIGSGKQEENLKEYAKENNINVFFSGNVPNNMLPVILNQHEIFILPSHYEGTPKVLLEAMACGLPCIGTNVEGVREIVKHNKNGYLCSTAPASIRNAIINVFEDKTLRQKISRNARRTILDNFSIERNLERETELFRLIPSQQLFRT